VIQVNVTSLQTSLKISKLKLLETLLIKDAKILHLNYHQQRLNQTFSKLFPQHKAFNLKELIELPKDEDSYRCRFIYCETDYAIQFIPYKPYYYSKYAFVPIDFNYDFKFEDRSKINDAKKELAEDCEAIFVKNGLITDTAISNIACLINSQWLTPKSPLLFGTTRARLLDEKKLQLADISVDACQNAEKIAFFNALTGFYELPVSI
jgi:4-amino-4-deoxychorismate lyase